MEYKEQLYVLQPEISAVYFTCRTCGNQLAMARVEDKCTNSMFCSCGRQYWVDWQEGVLHMGLDNHDELYHRAEPSGERSRIMDRVTGTLRTNGVGRRMS